MMRNLIKTIFLFSITVAVACTENENKTAVSKSHLAKEPQNIMVKAMDSSMHEMHRAKQTGNADYDFVAMMIPHHAGAVAMAKGIVKESKSEQLIFFANEIIVGQEAEIDQFKKFLDTAQQTPSKDATQIKKGLSNAMAAMMTGMKDWKSSGNLDRDFLELMIPHHQSAVDMASAYLPFAKDENIKKMATNIIQTQEKEINWMRATLGK